RDLPFAGGARRGGQGREEPTVLDLGRGDTRGEDGLVGVDTPGHEVLRRLGQRSGRTGRDGQVRALPLPTVDKDRRDAHAHLTVAGVEHVRLTVGRSGGLERRGGGGGSRQPGDVDGRDVWIGLLRGAGPPLLRELDGR